MNYTTNLKKIIHNTLKGVVLILLVILIFLWWATSPTLSTNNYKKEIRNTLYSSSHSDSTFSIITYNIGYLSGMTNNRPIKKPLSFFKENEKKAVLHFQKINADIIAFQEIDYNSDRSYNVNQQHSIAEKLQFPFVAQTVNWDKRYVPFPYYPLSMHFKKIVSGQSIFSKFPFKNHQRIELERVKTNSFLRDIFYIDRLLQMVTITINNTKIIVMNVHLEAFDAATRHLQTAFVIKKFKKYAKTYPVILLGDFNSDPTYKNASIFKILNLPNVGCAAFNNNYPFTFSSEKPFERLDYIFYTKKSIQCIEAKVLSEFGEISDHLPLLMRFVLK